MALHPGRSRRALGALFVVAIAVLGVRNVAKAVRNQRELKWDQRIGFRRSTELAELASRDRSDSVRFGAAFHYRLGDQIRGSRVVISPSMAELVWGLRGLAGLEVTVAARELEMDAARLGALDALSPHKARVGQRRIQVALEPGVTDYVLARAGKRGPLWWVPRRVFLAAGGVFE